MGEAWFQAEERYLYTELLEKPLSEVPANELANVLWDISGTSSFGHREEWDSWFKYLLPDLVLRGHEAYVSDLLVETTVTTFMLLFPSRLGEVYEGFREDALATLGACLMMPELWNDCEGGTEGAAYPVANFLVWEDRDGEEALARWHAGGSSSPISASLFFCLKYLNENEVGPWFESVVAIEDPYFRASLAVWLLGALDLLESEEPSPRELEKSNPQVNWHNSFMLESAYETRVLPDYVREPLYDLRDFLPRENCAALVREVRRLLTPEVIIAWAEEFSEDALLYESLYNVPDLLFDKLTKKQGAG